VRSATPDGTLGEPWIRPIPEVWPADCPGEMNPGESPVHSWLNMASGDAAAALTACLMFWDIGKSRDEIADSLVNCICQHFFAAAFRAGEELVVKVGGAKTAS